MVNAKVSTINNRLLYCGLDTHFIRWAHKMVPRNHHCNCSNNRKQPNLNSIQRQKETNKTARGVVRKKAVACWKEFGYVLNKTQLPAYRGTSRSL